MPDEYFHIYQKYGKVSLPTSDYELNSNSTLKIYLKIILNTMPVHNIVNINFIFISIRKKSYVEKNTITTSFKFLVTYN